MPSRCGRQKDDNSFGCVQKLYTARKRQRRREAEAACRKKAPPCPTKTERGRRSARYVRQQENRNGSRIEETEKAMHRCHREGCPVRGCSVTSNIASLLSWCPCGGRGRPNTNPYRPHVGEHKKPSSNKETGMAYCIGSQEDHQKAKWLAALTHCPTPKASFTKVYVSGDVNKRRKKRLSNARSSLSCPSGLCPVLAKPLLEQTYVFGA